MRTMRQSASEDLSSYGRIAIRSTHRHDRFLANGSCSIELRLWSLRWKVKRFIWIVAKLLRIRFGWYYSFLDGRDSLMNFFHWRFFVSRGRHAPRAWHYSSLTGNHPGQRLALRLLLRHPRPNPNEVMNHAGRRLQLAFFREYPGDLSIRPPPSRPVCTALRNVW